MWGCWACELPRAHDPAHNGRAAGGAHTRGSAPAAPGRGHGRRRMRASGGAAAVRGRAAAAPAAPTARARARAGAPARVQPARLRRRSVGLPFGGGGERAACPRDRPPCALAALLPGPGTHLPVRPRRASAAGSWRPAAAASARRPCARAKAWCPSSWRRCARWPRAVRAARCPQHVFWRGHGGPACGCTRWEGRAEQQAAGARMRARA